MRKGSDTVYVPCLSTFTSVRESLLLTTMATHKPHPLLKKPVFFIQRVPANLHQDDLLKLFPESVSNAMAVTLTQASTTRKNKTGDQVARVSFPDIATGTIGTLALAPCVLTLGFAAEKAMALLQFEILPTSNHSIGFCLKARSFPIKPRPAVSPRLFRYQTSGLTRSVIYDVLRLFGPIFLIRVKEQNTASVVFWKEEDADAAFQSLGQWRIDGESIGVQLWPVYPHDSQSSQAPNAIEAPITVQDTHSTAPGPAKTEPVVYDSCRLFCNVRFLSAVHTIAIHIISDSIFLLQWIIRGSENCLKRYATYLMLRRPVFTSISVRSHYKVLSSP